MNDPDADLLARVVQTGDFFHLVLSKDSLDDWNLARRLGEFLTRIEPDEAMGHAVLARAYRHLGDSKRALEELEQCRLRVRRGNMKASEAKLFSSLLAEEERLLGAGRGGGHG